MRLFISINLTEDLNRKITAFIDALKKELPGLVWVKPDNIHITLKFLGAVPDEKIERIKNAVKTVAASHIRTKIKLESVGCFPSPTHVRVLWVGVSEGAVFLKAVASDLDDELLDMFEKEKREFTPHITVARVRQPNKNLSDKIKRALATHQQDIFGEFVADRIYLMSSALNPYGPVYKEIFSVEFPQE